MKSKILFILIFLSLYSLPNYAFSQVGVDVNFELGFNGTVKVGRWNPVTVVIRTYSVPFKGSIEVEVIEGSIILGNITSIKLRSDVDLPVYSKGEFLFPVPLSDIRHPVKVTVYSSNGSIIKSSSFSIKDLDMRLPILCIVGNSILPYIGSKARTLALDIDSLRDRPFWILDPFDTLVLDYSSFKNLKYILDKWVLWGGRVVTQEGNINLILDRKDTYPLDIDLSSLALDIISEETVRLPSKFYASIILLFYLLFFVFLFHYSKRFFLHKVFIYILVTLIFSYLLFTATSSVREKSDMSVQVNILEADKSSPYARVYSGIAFFSPYSRTVSFKYDPNNFVFWIGKKGKYLAETRFVLKQKEISSEFSLGPNKIGLVTGWGTIDFDFKSHLSDWVLNIVNRSPYTINSAYLLYKGSYIPLGDIGIGSKSIKISNERLSTINEEGLKRRIFTWLKNNDIMLLGDKNYILGWIEIPLQGISLGSSTYKSLTLCLLEI